MAYGWGDDDNVSTKGGGYDYSSARNTARTYSAPKTPIINRNSCDSTSINSKSCSSTSRSYGTTNIPSAKNKDISTNSAHPVVIAIDVTGSMDEWPRIIFEKLPLLYTEVHKYLPDVEISFAGIGDVNSDCHPLQICDFAKGKDLDAIINSIYPEGGGGGQNCESYELVGHYLLNHCNIPDAKKPILVFTGDEGFYSSIRKDQVSKFISSKDNVNTNSMEVMKQLAEKFDTYILRKTYFQDTEHNIRKQWQEALGYEHVTKLEDPRRVVDCIIGIIANATGNFEDFSKNLSNRQTPHQVSQVMTSIRPALVDRNTGVSLRSTSSAGKTAKGLLP